MLIPREELTGIFHRFRDELGWAEAEEAHRVKMLDEVTKRAAVHLWRGEFHRTLREANRLQAFARDRRGRRAAWGWALRAAAAALLRHRLAERALRDAEAAVERIGEPPPTPPDHRWREP